MSWIGRYWWNLLVGAVGLLYLAMGIEADALARVLGIVGGILILAGAFYSRLRFAPWLVAVGALPFAALTWWSVVSPLLGILAIVFGLIMRRDARRRGLVAAPARSIPAPDGTGR
ncbi:MAG TPA: hypothetical protein VHK65_06450 [Candidatus Dormibacteraeota bacterium]|nr:hypothetical protein [Candidatus Dormibacteraeota bacterium]